MGESLMQMAQRVEELREEYERVLGRADALRKEIQAAAAKMGKAAHATSQPKKKRKLTAPIREFIAKNRGSTVRYRDFCKAAGISTTSDGAGAVGRTVRDMVAHGELVSMPERGMYFIPRENGSASYA